MLTVSVARSASLLVAFVLLLGGPALTATAAGPEPESLAVPAASTSTDAKPKQRLRELRFIDYNIKKLGFGAGWGNPSEPGRALDWALRVAQERRVLGLTLQEVCSDQVALLRLARPRWTIAATAIRVPHREACGYTQSSTGEYRSHTVMDVAIWTAGPRAKVSRVDLALGDERTLGSGERLYGDSMTCVSAVRFGTPMDVCSTHLPVRGDRGAYTNLIHRVSSPAINAGHLVVIGGDFNVQPNSDALDMIYQQGPGIGRFREAGDRQLNNRICRCGVATTAALDGTKRRKIDYLFVSANRVPINAKRTISAKVKPPHTNRAEYSDHFMLYAQVWAQTAR